MDDDQPDDFAKADRRHRKVIGPQPHRRQPQREARYYDDDRGQKGRRDPWQTGLGRNRGGIGAQPIKSRLSEVDLAGPAGHEVQTKYHDRVENGDVEELNDVAILRDQRNGQGSHDARSHNGPALEIGPHRQTFSLLFSPNRPRGHAMRTVIMTMKA